MQGEGRVLMATREYMLGESLPTLHVILRVSSAPHAKLQAFHHWHLQAFMEMKIDSMRC